MSKERCVSGIVYSRIVKKHIAIYVFLMFAVIAVPVAALEHSITLGSEDNWLDLAETEGVDFIDGKRGFTDIALTDGEYLFSSETDLLIHFNDTGFLGSYTLGETDPEITRKISRLGAGSGVFKNHGSGIAFVPGHDALFSPGVSWGDFTIEFWLYPATLDEGSTIISWNGSRFAGDTIVAQKVRCGIVDGALIWRFENVFLPPDYGESIVEIQGHRTLIPRQWRHHLLRYDSATNMLEYLVDGTPEAITHATSTGRERGVPYAPFTGEDVDNVLKIGEALNGLLDELRITKQFVDAPRIETYTQNAGTVRSRVFDLGYTNSALLRIETESSEPGDTAIRYFYRLGETMLSHSSIAGEWELFVPGTAFSADTRGRYLQLLVELSPDGTGEISPVLSTIDIYYEPDLPPHPPGWIEVIPGHQTLTVRWQAATDSDVAGYLVYYGDKPGRYFGTGSVTGSSPIDTGNTTEVELRGLENGRLYYIAVVSYDSSDPPHKSYFSQEAAARPSHIQ